MNLKQSYLIIFISTLLFTFCKQQKNELNAQEVPELFEGPKSKGIIENNKINEASGLAVSRSNANYIWTHNDSGGKARLFLFKNDGTHLGIFSLEDAKNRDWEDICAGVGPKNNKTYIYVGEIGDNRAVHDEYKIYRFEEPNLNAMTFPSEQDISEYATITYQYPDGKRDAEALMVDPVTKDIYIVSKREANVGIYRLAYPYSETKMNTLEKVGTIPYTWVNAGDISVDGSEILIKNYENIYYWRREKGETIAQALTKPATVVPYTPEPQGEAIAWKVDGTGYYTLSEEKRQEAELYLYERVK